MIKLFESTTKVFDTLGLGVLNDAISCYVVEERNGEFELEMEYPIDGIHFSEIGMRSIIVCKSNPFSNEQAFRVYYISKPISGVVFIRAEHISYDLSGYVVSPFEAANTAAALLGLKNNSVPACEFNFSTDKEVQARFKVQVPSSIRSLLGGVEGSILDVYGTGEYEFDNYNVRFLTHRGANRGVTIRYGKNLTDLTQEENCSSVYTAIYPFWAGTRYDGETSEDVLVTLPEKTINVEGTFSFTRIYPLDTGCVFTEEPSVDALRSYAERYINQNGIGKPDVSLNVSFIQLEQAEEYEQLRLLESVYLCDEVTVIFEELGVNSTAKCIKTIYNAITDKYESLEFGSTRTNLANTIVGQSEAIANAPTASFMEQEIKKSTDMITQNGLGGYVMLHRSAGQKAPDELLILDENSEGDYLKSQNVWRWNKEGLGFSSKGYNGPYAKIAITTDGRIVADEVIASGITAGTIEAKINMLAAYIADNIDITKASFYLDSATKTVHGATVDGCTIKGSTFEQSSSHGTLSIHDGWIYGDSSKDAGSAISFKGKDSESLYGSMYMHGLMLGMFSEVETVYVCLAGESKRSDRRLKQDISDLDIHKSIDFINNTQPREYRFKKKPDELRYGFIAQEVEENLDNCGLQSEGMIIKGADQIGLNYEDFIPHLVNYVKHLENEINELKRGDQVE